MSEYVKTNWAPGDLITAAKLLNLENGVEAAHLEIDTKAGLTLANVFTQPQTFQGGITDGNANTDISYIQSFGVPVDTRSWAVTVWTSDNKPQTIEVRDGATVVATIVLTYNTAGNPTQMQMTVGSKIVTRPVNWTGDRWDGFGARVVANA